MCNEGYVSSLAAVDLAPARLDGSPLSNPLLGSRRVEPTLLEIDPLIKLAMVTTTEAVTSAGMSGVSELTLGNGRTGFIDVTGL